MRRLKTHTGSSRHIFCFRGLRNWGRTARTLLGVVAFGWLWGVFHVAAVRAVDIGGPRADTTQPIVVASNSCEHWQQGGYEVYHLRGNCYLNQGLTYARGPEAVLWIDRNGAPGQPTKIIAYMEGSAGNHVAVDYQTGNSGAQAMGRQESSTWFQRMYTSVPIDWKISKVTNVAAVRPAIYERGLTRFDPQQRKQLELAQFTEFLQSPGVIQPLPPGMRSIQFFGRSDVAPSLESRLLPSGERVVFAAGGIRVLVEGLSSQNLPAAVGPIGTLDISTDRAVIWTAGGALGIGGQSMQSQETPLEIYMEGNIEFRQGDRVVYADRMYYDVRRQIGVILNAELLTPLPRTEDFEYQGLVRLRAAAIRQLDESHFTATNALVTTSRLEEPSYHFAAGQIRFEDFQNQTINPFTGEPEIAHRQLAESQGNFRLCTRGIPVFYWPTIATDLTKPSFFIDGVRVGNDDIFGTQVMVDLDAYQLFGLRNAPEGTDWGLSVDYLSDRGVGHGTNFDYDRQDFLGFIGPAQGNWEYWGIADDGLDNLGLGRRFIVPEEDYRFRLFGRHRQRLQSGWEATAEFGWISDRTFLEQYYEQDWDQEKDPRTRVCV